MVRTFSNKIIESVLNIEQLLRRFHLLPALIDDLEVEDGSVFSLVLFSGLMTEA